MATMPMVVREVHPPERMWAAPCRMIGMNKMDPALSNRVPMAHGWCPLTGIVSNDRTPSEMEQGTTKLVRTIGCFKMLNARGITATNLLSPLLGTTLVHPRDQRRANWGKERTRTFHQRGKYRKGQALGSQFEKFGRGWWWHIGGGGSFESENQLDRRAIKKNLKGKKVITKKSNGPKIT